MENKYQNGKIYKIVDNGFNKMYIGSTTQELSQRFAEHRRDYKRYLDNKGNFITVFRLFEEFGVENCKILLLELCPCDSMMKLNRKEGEYILKNDCVNRIVVGRTDKEYYEHNKEKIKQQCNEYRKQHPEWKKAYDKEYYEQNQDKLKAYQKEYREENADKIKLQKQEYAERNKDKIKERKKEYAENNKEKIQAYREQNKEKLLEQWREYRELNRDKTIEAQRKWREANKDKIKEYRENNKDKIKQYCKEKYERRKEELNTKLQCDCGGTYTIINKPKHENSIKHKTWLENSLN